MKQTITITLLSTVLTFGTAFADHHETTGTATAPENEPAVVEITEADFQAYNELMRADLRTRRMGFLAAYMDFDGDQSRAFWPIFREYEFESSQLNDGKIALIEDFMMHYDSLTDETARNLAERFFELEELRITILRKFFKKLSPEITAVKAAKFVQLENQLNNMINMQISSQIPLVQ